MSKIVRRLKRLPIAQSPSSLDRRINNLLDNALPTGSTKNDSFMAKILIWSMSCIICIILGYSLHYLVTIAKLQQSQGETHGKGHISQSAVLNQASDSKCDPFSGNWREVRTWVSK